MGVGTWGFACRAQGARYGEVTLGPRQAHPHMSQPALVAALRELVSEIEVDCEAVFAKFEVDEAAHAGGVLVLGQTGKGLARAKGGLGAEGMHASSNSVGELSLFTGRFWSLQRRGSGAGGGGGGGGARCVGVGHHHSTSLS